MLLKLFSRFKTLYAQRCSIKVNSDRSRISTPDLISVISVNNYQQKRNSRAIKFSGLIIFVSITLIHKYNYNLFTFGTPGANFRVNLANFIH